jgi:hypothetical protein
MNTQKLKKLWVVLAPVVAIARLVLDLYRFTNTH